LDSHQHDRRTRWPRIPHGSLGRAPNDRLGRRRQRQLFEHWREILRGCTQPDIHAYFNSNSYSDSYGNSDSYSNRQCDSNTNRNAKSHTNSETQSNTAVSP